MRGTPSSAKREIKKKKNALGPRGINGEKAWRLKWLKCRYFITPACMESAGEGKGKLNVKIGCVLIHSGLRYEPRGES